MEHRVSQLDNVYIFVVGKSTVDHTESTEEHAALCSFCCFLCRILVISTVSVWYGSNRGGATFGNRSNSTFYNLKIFLVSITSKSINLNLVHQNLVKTAVIGVILAYVHWKLYKFIYFR